MKRNVFITGCAIAFTASFLMSCGNKKNEDSANQQDLQSIEEMVQVVENPSTGINGTRYNAGFFNDEANKSDVATDSTYAVTDSGLKYVIAKEGKGKLPTSESEVTVHYVGTLTNGQQFDSSIDRGEVATFPLGMVIPGWTEGLQLMKEGGEAVFYIPSELAYGDRELPGIPANSPMIFWVQLIEVN